MYRKVVEMYCYQADFHDLSPAFAEKGGGHPAQTEQKIVSPLSPSGLQVEGKSNQGEGESNQVEEKSNQVQGKSNQVEEKSNQVQDSDTRLRHPNTNLDISENDLDTLAPTWTLNLDIQTLQKCHCLTSKGIQSISVLFLEPPKRYLTELESACIPRIESVTSPPLLQQDICR